MNVWLLNPYGALPEEGWREYRFTVLARALAKRGHAVRWFTADFSHFSKRFRSAKRVLLDPSGMAEAVTIRTTAYQRHVSMGRLLFEACYAAGVLWRCEREEPPDCIVAAEPSTSAPIGAVLAARFGVPLVADVIDLWPELFETVAPRSLRPLARCLLWPMRAVRTSVLRKASAVVAVSRSYAKVAKDAIGPTEKEIAVVLWGSAHDYVKTDGIETGLSTNPSYSGREPGPVRLVYAGTLGAHYDIRTLLDAAERLRGKGVNWELTIAGAGPLESSVESAAAKDGGGTVKWLGALDSRALHRLLLKSDVGICAYAIGSTVSLPIKAFDYFAAGLPILSNLQGELAEWLNETGTGFSYQAENVESLCTAIRRLAENREEVRSARRAVAKLAPTLTSEVQYDRYCEVIENAVTGRRSLAADASGAARPARGTSIARGDWQTPH